MAAIAILDGEAEELTRLCIEKAKEGDMTAMRLVMERRVSQRPVEISLPKISVAIGPDRGSVGAHRCGGHGEHHPGEAASLSMLIGNVAKAVEVCELADRLSKLEEQITAKGSNP